MNNSKGHLLIVDDEPEVARTLERALKRKGLESEILIAENEELALETLELKSPEVILLDLTLNPKIGPESGLKLLDEILENNSKTRVLVLTSQSASKYGKEALKRGALSFINKPADPDFLIPLIKDAVHSVNLEKQLKLPNTELSQSGIRFGLKTKSKSMLQVMETLNYACFNDQPILIYGETGTGKGVISRIIHSFSKRNKGPFIRYQPSFSNPDLVASELFGHKRGAFTGALEDRRGLIAEAEGGCLFIDEIDSLPKETQVLLLEVLQEKTFRRVGSNRLEKSNFRLITAINKPIKELIKKGSIREDFYHRISHITLDLPPLRERKDDISLLSEDFFNNTISKENLSLRKLETSAIKKIERYSWPGNIRELQATIERACHLAHFRGLTTLSADELQLSSDKSIQSKGTFRDQVHHFEETLVKKALEECGGNQVQASKSLGLDRTVLRRIMDRMA
jgi:DNA-binding NtrC family response regulator